MSLQYFKDHRVKVGLENLGEICPHCMSTTLPNSIVCRNCGASRYTGPTPLDFVTAAFMGGWIGYAVYYCVNTISAMQNIYALFGYIFVGVSIVVAACCMSERDEVYWRYNLRTRKPNKVLK